MTLEPGKYTSSLQMPITRGALALIAAAFGWVVAWIAVGLAANDGPSLGCFLLLLPASAAFRFIDSRHILIRIAVFMAISTIFGIVLHQQADGAEVAVYQHDHNALLKLAKQDYQELAEADKLTLQQYHRQLNAMIDRSRQFSKFAYASPGVLALLLFVTIPWQHPKRTYGVGLAVLCSAMAAGIWIPGPLTGYWAGNLGCMTCTYHHREFTAGKGIWFNICGAISLDGTIHDSTPKAVSSKGNYIFDSSYETASGNKHLPDSQWRVYLYRIAYMVPEGSAHNRYSKVLGFRSFDYFTHHKMKKYITMIADLRSLTEEKSG
jgi:hypothetical protein